LPSSTSNPNKTPSAPRHGNLPVIEDAAQSFGASYKGKRSGNLSTIGCTSFFPSKPLGCYGDGGAIFTSDDRLAQACREIRVHGLSARHVHSRIGVGGRMDTLQAAIVLAKLPRFEHEIAQRQAIARQYHDLLATEEQGITQKQKQEIVRALPCSSVFFRGKKMNPNRRRLPRLALGPHLQRVKTGGETGPAPYFTPISRLIRRSWNQ